MTIQEFIDSVSAVVDDELWECHFYSGEGGRESATDRIKIECIEKIKKFGKMHYDRGYNDGSSDNADCRFYYTTNKPGASYEPSFGDGEEFGTRVEKKTDTENVKSRCIHGRLTCNDCCFGVTGRRVLKDV